MPKERKENSLGATTVPELPLVSSIIIFLNEERFLAEAIESAIAQTYPNWELLLIDDGSTDSSAQIANTYVQQYADTHPGKVRYLTHQNAQNQGMSASRNLGIAAAKGKYIAFLDGDDVWTRRKLSEQVALIKTNPNAAMVYGLLLDWHSWNPSADKPDGLYGTAKDGSHPYFDQVVEPPNLLALFLENEVFIPSSGLINKERIQAVGGFEDIFRSGYSDAVALVKLCLAEPVMVSSQCWYHYRQHPNSSTAIAMVTGEEVAEKIAYLNWVKDYFMQQNVSDRRLWRSLNRAMWPYQHPKLQQLITLKNRGLARLENLALTSGRWILPKPLRHWLWTTVKGESALS